MTFSSLIFVFGFLPCFFLLYFLTPNRYKNYTALLGSLLFYAWGAPRFVVVLLITCVFDYYLSRLIYENRDNPIKKRRILCISIALNVCILFYFKYANFFVTEVNEVLTAFGFHNVSWTSVALPIGISFFTFHEMSYVIDVYRGLVAPANNIFTFLFYITFFPQLIAGPIIRYHDVADQIIKREHSADKVFWGIHRFTLGLAKKVIIADVMAEVADKIFALQLDQITPFYAWLGALCYAMQIYFDFSGYSDMAIGLARIMGIRFLENFNRPYISKNITEFWRRWHISLSNWMKEYLYIPLGGNRVSPLRRYLNLCVVFTLSGLWHGAAWTFIFWGLYHGLFLVLDKLFWVKVSERLPGLFNVALTFVLVLFGWVLFRAETLVQALGFAERMLGIGTHGESDVLLVSLINNRGWVVLIAALFGCFLPSLERVSGALRRKWDGLTLSSRAVLGFSSALLFFALSSLALTNSNFHPFIYYRF